MPAQSPKLYTHNLGIKRRAASPPQWDEAMRRMSTDNLSMRSWTLKNDTGRASSFSSINSAYSALGLNSPAADQSIPPPLPPPRFVHLSRNQMDPEEKVPFHLSTRRTRWVWIRQAVECHPVESHLSRMKQGILSCLSLGEHFPKSNIISGFYMCDCCPKMPKKFDTRAELR